LNVIFVLHSGVYGVRKQMCARMAYEGLMEFVHHLQSVPQNARHLQHVHFVNIDRETTEAMSKVMKSLYDKKHMFPSQPEQNAQTDRYARADSVTASDGHPRQSEAKANDAVDHHQQNVYRRAVSASESGEDVFVNETNKTPQQSLSEISRQNSSSFGDDDRTHVPTENDDRPMSRDPEVSLGTEERKPGGEHQDSQTTWFDDGEDSDVQHLRSKFYMMGNNGEDSRRMDDDAGANPAAASANEDDKEETDAAGLKLETASPKPARSRALKKDDCVICLEQMTDPKQLDCVHKFCENCIAEYFEKGQPKCPSCGKLFGVLKGNQPQGTFTSRCIQQMKLAGYEHYGAIEITYQFPDGTQTVSNVICVVVLEENPCP